MLTLIRLFVEKNIEYRVFGATSNCLFLNECAFNVFIFTELLNQVIVSEHKDEIVCGAGVMLPVFVRKASDAGYCGFEGLCGILGQ